MALNKDEILAELRAAGIELTGQESWQDLKKLHAGLTKGENADTRGNFIVWLKGRAYINDKEQRLDAGVYVVEEVPVRLSKLSASIVEVFENEVPSKKLAQIARWAGINPDDLEDDEILSKVISEPKPF